MSVSLGRCIVCTLVALGDSLGLGNFAAGHHGMTCSALWSGMPAEKIVMFS